MIEISNLTKKFDNYKAIDDMTCKIPDGCIYGMVGSNGAGKSTFLRTVSGIYKNDLGTVKIDGENVFNNPSAKSKIIFVPDDLYFLPGANLKRMAELYSNIYPSFDYERYNELVKCFNLSENYNLSTFSKGMKRQAATILALSARPQYLFFDETFDGLDPVMRNFVKNLIYNDVMERKLTTIITSHSLRELEDICDSLVLLHKGGIVMESDLDSMKHSAFKIQVAFNFDYDKSLFNGLEIVKFSKQGSVTNLIVSGDEQKAKDLINANNPIIFEILPLTLEEVFILQMKGLGYDFSEILEEMTDEK